MRPPRNFALNKPDGEKRHLSPRVGTDDVESAGSIRAETNETVTRLRAGLRGRSPTPPHFADSSSGRHHISPRKNQRLPGSAKLRDRQPDEIAYCNNRLWHRRASFLPMVSPSYLIYHRKKHTNIPRPAKEI